MSNIIQVDFGSKPGQPLEQSIAALRKTIRQKLSSEKNPDAPKFGFGE